MSTSRPASAVRRIKQMAILNDVTKCIGCEQCVDACRSANGLPRELLWRWVKGITDLSSARWTTIVEQQTPKGRRFVRRQCRHCLRPACVEACIVGALRRTPEGAVVYDKEKCIGCRYCMVACPWSIPRYSWERRTPLIQKCIFCHERFLKQGLPPACTATCPNGATIFGGRRELLAEARRRISSSPGSYINHVWGEGELGGASVLYISDVEPELGITAGRVRDTTPVPERTFRVLKRMPTAFVGMAAIMIGTWWVMERRE